MLQLLPQIPAYMSYRSFGWPRLLPLNIVLSVTYRCNSRCRSCNVWRRDSPPELTLQEWEQVFRRIGPGPYYLTFSGGEPFLRRDLPELVGLAWEYCRPAVITIPTNGLLPDLIPPQVERLLRAAPQAQVGINLSLDGIGAAHDELRGVPGNWERALETYRQLQAMQSPNLILGIHTVISRFNVVQFPDIYCELMALQPDSYITEVAEERVELGTVGSAITPSAEEYARVAAFLRSQLREEHYPGFARLTQAFRGEYYRLAPHILAEKRQVIPCHAGWASGHIAPQGDVWTCCTRAEPIGNLRETDYDLRPIWFGERAEALRRSIRAGECYCPMANASYTNMLLHPPTLARVVWSLNFPNPNQRPHNATPKGKGGGGIGTKHTNRKQTNQA